MAIKQSTQDTITAALRNEVDTWQVFGVYEYGFPCRSCACGHKIQRTFVLCRKDDHGPAFGEMVELGSECIKFVAKVSPDLYQWLLTKKAEIERIQRQMKKQREVEFHASETWKELSRRLYSLDVFFRAFNPTSYYMRTLNDLGINLKEFYGGFVLREMGATMSRVTHGKLYFEDDTRPTHMLKTSEAKVAEFIEFLRPHREALQAKAATVPANSPSGSILNAILGRM